MTRTLTKTSWCVLFLLAFLNGVFALRYLIPRAPMAAPLLNYKLHRLALAGHAACAGVALLLGPLQFVQTLRRHGGAFHRRVGWIYIVAVGLGAAFAVPLSLRASSGPIAAAGFLTLDAAWILATANAVRWTLRRRFDLHRRWMLRSYALTAAAISLRIMLPLSAVMGLPAAASYRAIAWLCWLVNLGIVEMWIRLTPRTTSLRTAIG